MSRQVRSNSRSQYFSHQQKLTTAAITASMAVIGAVSTAQGQVYWDSGGGTNTAWSNGVNWDIDSVPFPTDDAYLNNGGTVTVNDLNNKAKSFSIGLTADTSLSPSNLGLGGTVNFVAGGELTTGGVIPSVDIGVNPGTGTSVWNHLGGTLTTGNLFRLGVATGATGTLNMSGGTIDVSTGDTDGIDFFLVGDNGNGIANMTGGTIKSRGYFAVALQPTSTSTMTVSGGTIDGRNDFCVGDVSNIAGKTGANGTINMTGGNVTFTGATFMGRSAFSHGTINQSGGTLTTREVLCGLFSDSTYNVSGNAILDVNGQINIATFTPIERPDGAPDQPKSVFSQSGNAVVTAGGMIVGEFGDGTYNMNGGTLTIVGAGRNGNTGGFPNDTFKQVIIGRDGGGAVNQGRGRFNQTAGTVNVATNIVLGDFDDSTGVYDISGGTLAIGGNLVVGGALASNAPTDAARLEPSVANGAQGQALRSNGTFIVRGGAAAISIAGKLIANPADKGAFRNAPADANKARFNFQVGANGALTRINVTGVSDIDGATIDMGFLSTTKFVPAYNQKFSLINTQLFGATGTGTTQNVGTGSGFVLSPEDAADWSVAVVTGGDGRQTLVATNLAVPGDATGDKRVNFDDLVPLAQHYNQTGFTRAGGDFDRDGIVNFDDLVILSQNYNFIAPGAVIASLSSDPSFASDWVLARALVPEPTTLSLGAAALAMVARRRRA